MTNDNTIESLHAGVSEFLGDSRSIDADANLFEAGLDSVGLLRLVNKWRRDGIEVSFAELAQNPTLAAWASVFDAASTDHQQPSQADSDTFAPESDTGTSPLGVMQHAYWVGRSPDQRLGGVAAHLYTEFDLDATGEAAAIDPEKLRRALASLIDRHETLRLRITSDGQQDTLPSVRIPLEVHDLASTPGSEVQSHLAEIRERYSHQLLNVEEGHVFALALSLLPDGATRLHVDVDMIAADAVSYRTLMSDLAALYDSPSQATAGPALSYKQYLADTSTDRTNRAQKAERAWADRIHELPGAPVLPEVINPTNEAPEPRVARRHVWLDPARKASLMRVAQTHGVTVPATVATVLAEVIGRWSLTDHFLLNVPIFDRLSSHPEIDRVVGDFSSSIMLEVDLRKTATFLERVRSLQEQMHADAAHSAYSGLEVLRDMSRLRGETVLAPVVFTSALGLGELFSDKVTETFGRPTWVISQGPQVLLDAQVTEFENGILVNWDSREEALPIGTVDAMFKAFAELLEQVIDTADAWNDPVKLSISESGDRTVNGENVQIVDNQGRVRPNHVPGRLVYEDDGPASELPWGRADGLNGVKLLGNETERLDVHGVSVGPEEISEALRANPLILDVHVQRWQGSFAAVAVIDAGKAVERLSSRVLRNEFAKRLPSHLVPAYLVLTDQIPGRSEGRIDQEAVESLFSAAVQLPEFVPPSTDLEEVISQIWAEVLGLDRVGVAEEFLALGGDSLLAARVVSQVQEELDTNAASLRALFSAPTIRDFAQQLRDHDEPGRLDEVAAIVKEIRSMSDEEIAAQLGESTSAAPSAESGGV